MIRIGDPLIALLVDEALAIRLGQFRTEQARRAQNPSDGAIPDGYVYESATDIVH
jgi:hypothetical protein